LGYILTDAICRAGSGHIGGVLSLVGVGTSPGITQGRNGGTHMCFHDLAIMRAIANMHVYSPADVAELRSALFYMAASKQPTYL
jgi:transketolase C-terminal domain/subunit